MSDYPHVWQALEDVRSMIIANPNADKAELLVEIQKRIADALEREAGE